MVLLLLTSLLLLGVICQIQWLLNALAALARQGRWALVLGLAVAIAVPALADALAPSLAYWVAFLIFLNALRIGPTAIAAHGGTAFSTIKTVLVLQLGLPLLWIGTGTLFGWADHLFSIAVLITLSASSISGAPTFAVLLRHAPDPALLLLIFGTCALPLTLLPILWLSPVLTEPWAIILSALRLAGVLALSIAAGFVLRPLLCTEQEPRAIPALDGISAITLCLFVIALMSAVGPALRSDPISLVPWLALATLLNFGAQILARRLGADGATALVAGNRNIALFLVALPPEITEPLMLFIGCYQIPMYLTPLVMKPIYDRS